MFNKTPRLVRQGIPNNAGALVVLPIYQLPVPHFAQKAFLLQSCLNSVSNVSKVNNVSSAGSENNVNSSDSEKQFKQCKTV